VNEEKPRKLPQLECHPLSSMRVKIELLTRLLCRTIYVIGTQLCATNMYFGLCQKFFTLLEILNTLLPNPGPDRPIHFIHNSFALTRIFLDS